jgi:hypothetical protein
MNMRILISHFDKQRLRRELRFVASIRNISAANGAVARLEFILC